MDVREISCFNYSRNWEGVRGAAAPGRLGSAKIGIKMDILNKKKTAVLHSTKFKILNRLYGNSTCNYVILKLAVSIKKKAYS